MVFPAHAGVNRAAPDGGAQRPRAESRCDPAATAGAGGDRRHSAHGDRGPKPADAGRPVSEPPINLSALKAARK